MKKAADKFELPKEYVERMKLGPFDTGFGWCLIEQFPLQFGQWQETLKTLYPSRNLFPFAKRWANDDIACFDLNDFSDDPKVCIIHAFASPGWEYSGDFPNYASWQKHEQQRYMENES